MTGTTVHVVETATAKKVAKGRYEITVLTPGQGSSGYYAPDVVKEAAAAFKTGLHMYLDHPTMTERWERPERSVNDLAAAFESDATWTETDGGGLTATIQVVPHKQELVESIWPYIGVSIRANAISEWGTNPDTGQETDVITQILAAESVDFVTKAGRGGKVTAALESFQHKDLPGQPGPVTEKEKPMELTEAQKAGLVALPGVLAALEARNKADEDAAKLAAEEAAKNAPNPLDVATAFGTKLAESELKPAQYARVTQLVKGGMDVDEAIKSEVDYAKAIIEGAKTTGDAGETGGFSGTGTTSTTGTLTAEESSTWGNLVNSLAGTKAVQS